MGRSHRTLLAAALALASLRPSPASARAHRDVDYRYEQVWNAAIRMLRVDHRFPIEERDDAHGFVLFTFREYGRDHAASLEVVRTSVDGVERVRLVLQLEGMPTHAETALLEELERKLRSDYGMPERRPPATARAPSPLIPRLSERTPDDRAASEARAAEAERPTTGTPPRPAGDSAAAAESGAARATEPSAPAEPSAGAARRAARSR